jgi:4-hydroxy-tetrahydrodipicolinate synthase
VVRRCLDLRNCRGLKDSSGDFHYFKRMQRIVAPSGVHSIFIGPEELLAESLFSGGDGGVSGGANVWPELYTRIFALTEAGDWPGAQAAQARVMELSRKVYSIGGYGSTVTKALKMALDLQGICGPAMALPHLGWDEAARVTLRRELSALGLSGTRPELQECPAK